jgi:hypothetical protein
MIQINPLLDIDAKVYHEYIPWKDKFLFVHLRKIMILQLKRKKLYEKI